MAQCVKVPTSKPDKPISIPKTCGMEGGTSSYSVSSDLLTDTTAHVCTSMRVHTQTHMPEKWKVAQKVSIYILLLKWFLLLGVVTHLKS